MVKRILALLLTILMIVGLTACTDREPEPQEPESSRPSVSSRPESSAPEEPSYELTDFPDFAEQIEEMKAINAESVGWLHIPGTEVNDVVVCRQDPADYNQYYLRKDIYLNYSMEGVYYADCRNTFDGTAKGLSQNTTIYGHALDMNDDPDEIRFSQLKKFWDQDFANEHPYIYFSLDGEDLVWEIFACFYTNSITHDYINPLDGWEDGEIQEWLDEIQARSDFTYKTDVSPDDQFLTLSTCVYKLTPGVYPNDYRYVVMAKLVDDDRYREFADLEANDPLGPDEAYAA